MPSRTARLSKKGCGFATPECRAQRDVAVHPRPAPPPPLLAAPRPSTTALGYREIRWVVRCAPLYFLSRPATPWPVASILPPARWSGLSRDSTPTLDPTLIAIFSQSMLAVFCFLSRNLEGGCGRIGPGQELVETALGMTVDAAADHVGQV